MFSHEQIRVYLFSDLMKKPSLMSEIDLSNSKC